MADDKIKTDTKIKTTTTEVTKKSAPISSPTPTSMPSTTTPTTPSTSSTPSAPSPTPTSPPPSPEPRIDTELAQPANREPQPQQPPSQPSKPQQPSSEPSSPSATSDSSDISPSLKKEDLSKKVDLGNKPKTQGKLGKAGKEGLENAAKTAGKDVAKQAGKKAASAAAKKGIATALGTVVPGVGNIAALAASFVVDKIFTKKTLYVVIFMAILIIAPFVLVMADAFNGGMGKTLPKLAKAGSAEVKAILADNSKGAGGVSGTTNGGQYHNFDFLAAQDKTYVQDGKTDSRLLTILHYLSAKHNRIGVSHIISGYEGMGGTDNQETATDRDPNLIKNISAHKDGLAADIAQIDFVYKALEPSQVCTAEFTGGVQLNDVVYYADGMATTDPASIGQTNTPTDAATASTVLANSSNSLSGLNPQTPTDKQKIQNAQNTLNQSSLILQNASGGLTNLKNNMAAANSNIAKMHDTVNTSNLPAEQKAALNQKIDLLSQQLKTLSYQYVQLDQVVNQFQARVSQALASVQSDVNNLTVNLDNLNVVLAPVGGIGNVSIIHNLDGLNSSLGGINSSLGSVVGLSMGLGSFGGIGGGGNELLRLYCEGGPTTGAATKEAIPIKVSWQDVKPGIPHVSADNDDSLTTDPRVFYTVYQPQAQLKTHQLIAEILQFPYETKDKDTYRVTQIITYSLERDVTPFAAVLDKLYGTPRPDNYGLFQMPESWAQVHVAY